MKKLSIIILGFNKWKYSEYALNDLIKLKDHEIIFVDNASTDETSEISRSKIY